MNQVWATSQAEQTTTKDLGITVSTAKLSLLRPQFLAFVPRNVVRYKLPRSSLRMKSENTSSAGGEPTTSAAASIEELDKIDLKLNAYLDSPQGKSVVNGFAQQAVFTLFRRWTLFVTVFVALAALVGFTQLRESIYRQLEQRVEADLAERYDEEIGRVVAQYDAKFSQLENLVESRIQRLLELSDDIAVQRLKMASIDDSMKDHAAAIERIVGDKTRLAAQLASIQKVIASDDQLRVLDLIANVQELMQNKNAFESLEGLRTTTLANAAAISRQASHDAKLKDAISSIETSLSQIRSVVDPVTGRINAAQGSVIIDRTSIGNGTIAIKGKTGKPALQLEVDRLGNGKITVGEQQVIVGVSSNSNGGIWIKNSRGVEITNLGSDSDGNGLVRTFSSNDQYLNELSPLRMPKIQSH